MLTELRRQYQALERAFCWMLEESAHETRKFAESEIFLIHLSWIGGKKNAGASGVAWG